MLVTKRVQLCHAWEGYMQCVESAAWRRIPLQWQRLTTSTGSWQLFIFVKVPLEKWQRASRPVRSRLFSVPIGLRHSSYFFPSKGRYDLIWEKYKSWVNLRPTYVVTWMTKGAFREKKNDKKGEETRRYVWSFWIPTILCAGSHTSANHSSFIPLVFFYYAM